MSILFNDYCNLSNTYRNKSYKCYIDLLTSNEDIFKQLLNVNKEFLKMLISVMPDSFAFALPKGEIIDNSECTNFINTVCFNVYLILLNKNDDTKYYNYDKSIGLLEAFFNDIYGRMLENIKEYELFTHERKELEKRKNMFYLTFENEVMLISLTKNFKLYFKALVERLKLLNNIDIKRDFIVADCRLPNSVLLEFNIIKG